MGFVDNKDTDEPVVLPDGSELDFSEPEVETEADTEEPEQEISPDEPQQTDAVETVKQKRSVPVGRVLITVVAAILGVVVGAIPAVAGALIFGATIPFLFLAMPICICGAIALLHGCRDWRALAVTIVFSVVGMYYIAVSCKAAIYVAEYGMSILNIPLVTATQFGNTAIFADAGMSAYVFPFVFTALGVAISWLTLNKTAASEE